MMNLNQRITLLSRLGDYILSDTEEWKETRVRAEYSNPWFISEFTILSTQSIAKNFLDIEILKEFTGSYPINDKQKDITVGIVMAGNIPLVGFHDFICSFLCGYNIRIKASAKDEILITHLIKKLAEWDKEVDHVVSFTPMLKGCHAYIATGSNNSGRYFDYYFGKYPHLIRRNRTSVAILSGNESDQELDGLADDINLYFGLGCRNVTKLYAPENFDFIPLLNACKKYNYFIDHNKYKNNYDYHLAIHLLNNQFYMSSGSLLLVENKSLFSPIAELHYEFYKEPGEVEKQVSENKDVQCISGPGFLPFGQVQFPSIFEYADGIDTMEFLCSLPSAILTVA
jgi:hypothetical protein